MVWTNLLLGILEVFIMAGSMYYFMSRIRHEIERKKWEYLLVFFLYGCLTFAYQYVDNYFYACIWDDSRLSYV